MINETHFLLKRDGAPCKGCLCRTPELIENYDRAIADDSETWVCHHRLETHNSDGERRSVNLLSAELIALGMYFDRPPEELIFLPQVEHQILHNKGKHRSEESRKKQSESRKGRQPSEESRRKMSVAKSEYNKSHGIVPPSQKGKCWFTNGEINVKAKKCPEGFVPGMMRHTNKQCSQEILGSTN